MKVGVFLANKLPEIGGGYTFEREIIHALAKWGAGSRHTFVVLSWTKEPPLELSSVQHLQFISLARLFEDRPQLSKRGISILEKLRISRINFKLATWKNQVILNALATNGIDLTWSLTPACIALDVPYITTVWDLQHRLQPYFPEVSARGAWDAREQLYGTLLRRASFILTGTEIGKAEIERFYQVAAERVKVLPMPTPQFSLNARQDNRKQILKTYNIPENYLFYPAQFWSHKNHVSLLLAVQWLRDRYDLVFPVVFAGSDAGNQSYIQQWAIELNLSEQVYFLGFVPQEDLIALYCNAFALTFVTFFGPDNLPPLEAFALGCPVVASNVPGAREQLGDAALLVEPTDEKQLALAIKSLYDDPGLRQAIVQRGLARASQWTGQDYVKGIFSILDDFEGIRRCWSSTEL